MSRWLRQIILFHILEGKIFSIHKLYLILSNNSVFVEFKFRILEYIFIIFNKVILCMIISFMLGYVHFEICLKIITFFVKYDHLIGIVLLKPQTYLVCICVNEQTCFLGGSYHLFVNVIYNFPVICAFS